MVKNNYINIRDEMKKIVKSSLDGGEALWFGCDVDKYLEKSESRFGYDKLQKRI